MKINFLKKKHSRKAKLFQNVLHRGWFSILLFPLILFSAGCKSDRVEDAGEFWCNCVEDFKSQGKDDNQVFEACWEEINQEENFDFIHVYGGGKVDHNKFTSEDYIKMDEDFYRWLEYRANHCRLDVHSEQAIP